MTTTTNDKKAEKRTSRVKPENFVLVQGWMLTDLHLSGNDLLVYAIISGFCQDGESSFRGSLQYLADWTGSTRRGVMKNLSRLMDRGLIARGGQTKDGVFEYRTTKPAGSEQSSPVNKVHQGGEQSSPGGVNKVHQGGEQSSPNNIVDNTVKNTVDSTDGPADALESDDTESADVLPFEDRRPKPRDFSDSLRVIMDAWNEMIISLRETRGIKRSAIHRVTSGTSKYANVCNVLKAYSEDQIVACIKAAPRVEHWLNPTSRRIVESGWKLNFGWFFEKFWDVVLPQMELMDVLVPVRAGSNITYRVNDIPAAQTQQTQQTQTQQAKAEPVMVGGFAFPE